MLKRGLFVGRFQPFHNGHLEAVRYILERVEELILVVGSAQHSHEIMNPFTAGERVSMVQLALKDTKIDPARYLIVPVPDVAMHSTWFSELQAYVPSFDAVFSNEPLTRRLVKEARCRVEYVPLFQREIYWATEIRKRMLSGGDWTELVPKSVADFIKSRDGVKRIVELEQRDIVNHG
ncbi:MAG: nicotinamide-nucleotide adenylyltransferase [Nitrososphaerales archaeon]